jgi:hypothetical protein
VSVGSLCTLNIFTSVHLLVSIRKNYRLHTACLLPCVTHNDYCKKNFHPFIIITRFSTTVPSSGETSIIIPQIIINAMCCSHCYNQGQHYIKILNRGYVLHTSSTAAVFNLGYRYHRGVREDMLRVNKIKKKLYTKQAQSSH